MNDFAEVFALPISDFLVSEPYRWISLEIGSPVRFKIFVQSDWQILKNDQVVADRSDEKFEKLKNSPRVFLGEKVEQITMSGNPLVFKCAVSNGYLLQVVDTQSFWGFVRLYEVDLPHIS